MPRVRKPEERIQGRINDRIRSLQPARQAYMREYLKKYNAANRDKLKIQQACWHRENEERLKPMRKAWVKANPDKMVARGKRYRAKHQDKIVAYAKSHRERNLAHYVEYGRIRNASLTTEQLKQKREKTKAWHKAHPEFAIERTARRRALKQAAGINLAGIQKWVASIKAQSSFVCYYCCDTFLITEVHFDHIIPIVRGGSHSASNLCASCVTCNISKHSKLPHEWKKHAQIFLSL